MGPKKKLGENVKKGLVDLVYEFKHILEGSFTTDGGNVSLQSVQWMAKVQGVFILI